MKYDAFISYASEDKDSFVTQFAKILRGLGAQIWFDQFILRVGDSLSKSIDKGLTESTFGIVVLSPSFLAKAWPEYELRGLVSREIDGRKVIIPIWHNVSRDDVLRFSPPLADKLAIKSSDKSILEAALHILEVIRPDLLESWRRRVIAAKIRAEAPLHKMPIELFVPEPVRHETLPKSLLLRIKLNCHILQDVLPMSLEETIDGFKRDKHPEREIVVWELIAACYIEAKQDSMLSGKKQEDVLSFFLKRTNGPLASDDLHAFPSFTKGEMRRLEEIYVNLQPKEFEI